MKESSSLDFDGHKTMTIPAPGTPQIPGSPQLPGTPGLFTNEDGMEPASFTKPVEDLFSGFSSVTLHHNGEN